MNINECFNGAANCHANAVCSDKDATLNASLLYECICPPGMAGDGVTTCELVQYQTQLKLEQPGTTVQEFDEAAFKSMLYSTGAVPATVDPSSVYVIVSDSASGGAARRLLQASGSGIQITVTIYSESQELMSNVTSSINTDALQSSGFVVTEPPTNVVYQDGNEPTVVQSTGFRVTAVQFDDRTSQWLVDVRYTHNVPNTLTSLYISKPGDSLPYSQAVKNTYYISKHPCVIYNAVCCLSDYAESYQIGAFSGNISRVLGDCNSTVQGMHTLGMFDTSRNSEIVERALEGYPDSSVVRMTESTVRLRIAQTDLSVGGLAMRSPLESNPAGYQLTFFVGMSYFTLLDANAMSVSATQTTITLAVSNSITFSFSSAQDYSLVKYVTLTVMQNKWLDGLVQRRMQFIQMGFVLPVNTRQNMQTGLIPLTSVRFAIAKNLPDRNNASLWTNPCYSGYGRAMYDAGQGYKEMYKAASSQPCASDYNMCMNPLVSVLPTNLVNFYFPVGDSTIGSDVFNSPEPYSIYVMFQLSVITPDGKSFISNVFARAQLHADNVISSCDSEASAASLLSTTTVDIAVGFVGTQSAWNSTMVVYKVGSCLLLALITHLC